MTANEAARDLLEAVAGYADQPTNGYTPSADRAVLIGTVDAAYSGTGNAKVLFDGETVAGSRTYVVLEPVSPSDRVLLVPVGRSYVIAGKVGGGSFWGVAARNRNRIANGAMNIWQRGTSFASPASGAYTADRFVVAYDGTGATRTVSQQAFAAGSELCDGPFYLRYAQTVAGTGGTSNVLAQRIEDVRTSAGETVTASFWAKLAAAGNITVQASQNFGTGGSAKVSVAGSAVALTTSWARYAVTLALPSVAGKTIGAGSFLALELALPVNATFTLDLTGVQLEAGLNLTPFERLSAGQDLLACQRYYYRLVADSSAMNFGTGSASTTTNATCLIPFPMTMRATPTVIDASAGSAFQYRVGASIFAGSGIAISGATSVSMGAVDLTSTGLTSGSFGILRCNGTVGTFLGFSAEL
jgi:hypothetical protein